MNNVKNESIKYIPKGVESAYTATVAKVPFIVESLVGALKEHNSRDEYKPEDPSFVLDCLFVPHYLEDLKRAKYADYDEDIRDEVMKIAVKKIPSPLLEAVAEARRQFAGLAVSTIEGTKALNLTRSDIVYKGGKYTVSPSHKSRFIDSVTVYLDADEMELYKLMVDAVPRLRSFRDKGFNIDRLMQTYVNRYGGLSGEPTFDDLLRDVHRFRMPVRLMSPNLQSVESTFVKGTVNKDNKREMEILAEKERRQEEHNRKTM